MLNCPVCEYARAVPISTGNALAVQKGARNSSSQRINFDCSATEFTEKKINLLLKLLHHIQAQSGAYVLLPAGRETGKAVYSPRL